MSCFHTTPRDLNTLPSHAIVPQDKRPTNQGKLDKLCDSTTDVLTNVFDSIPLDDVSEQIINNYTLTMRVRDFTRYLQQYNMKEVFNTHRFSDSSASEQLHTTLN